MPCCQCQPNGRFVRCSCVSKNEAFVDCYPSRNKRCRNQDSEEVSLRSASQPARTNPLTVPSSAIHNLSQPTSLFKSDEVDANPPRPQGTDECNLREPSAEQASQIPLFPETEDNTILEDSGVRPMVERPRMAQVYDEVVLKRPLQCCRESFCKKTWNASTELCRFRRNRCCCAVQFYGASYPHPPETNSGKMRLQGDNRAHPTKAEPVG